MKKLFFLCFAALLAAGTPVLAGGMYSSTPYCRYYEQADELVAYSRRERRALMSEVEWRYHDAVEVSRSPKAVYRVGGVAHRIDPLYLWANQAKINCAKALGYLKKWHHTFGAELDWETLQKCECFHERMVYYKRH